MTPLWQGKPPLIPAFSEKVSLLDDVGPVAVRLEHDADPNGPLHARVAVRPLTPPPPLGKPCGLVVSSLFAPFPAPPADLLAAAGIDAEHMVRAVQSPVASAAAV